MSTVLAREEQINMVDVMPSLCEHILTQSSCMICDYSVPPEFSSRHYIRKLGSRTGETVIEGGGGVIILGGRQKNAGR